MALKFKIDENLPVELAEMLIAAGHDAMTIGQQGMGGADDEPIAAACRAEGRGLVTLDTDFADIRRYPPADYAGLLVLRLWRQDRPHVLGVFQRVVPLHPTDTNHD